MTTAATPCGKDSSDENLFLHDIETEQCVIVDGTERDAVPGGILPKLHTCPPQRRRWR